MFYKNIDFQNKINPFRYRTKKLVLAGVVISAVLIAFFALKNVMTADRVDKTPVTSKIALQEAKAKADINKTLSFPLIDQKGKEVSRIEYSIINAELQDQIISKGKNYTTVKGRTILIINLKITNQHEKSIEINSKDYIRLTVNGSPELLAADINNDPVMIQATSTKYTRLGFPISDTDKNIKLIVGEIGSSKKEEVPISF